MTLTERIETIRHMARNGECFGSAALIRLLDKVEPIVRAQEQRLETVLRSLSYSEEQILRTIVAALPTERGGCVVTSRIADEHHATRSMAFKALGKLEAAGLAEIRSMGMKGTHVRLLGITRTELLRRLARTA